MESVSEIARTGTPAGARKSGWTYRPSSGWTISGWTMVLLIIAVWIVAALLIDPRGEFPLNDDWAYAAAVKTLLGGGGIRLSGWTTVNLIAQIFWGALFCLPFGFSFTALRISTLVLGLTGVLGYTVSSGRAMPTRGPLYSGRCCWLSIHCISCSPTLSCPTFRSSPFLSSPFIVWCGE